MSLAPQVDSLFTQYDRPDAPGCAVGLIQHGELIYTRGYGCANLEYDIPITPDTVFDIGSISKQFTAACIALLEEAGQLHADADIRTYLPELPDWGHTLRLKDLIHMTNGLYDIYALANYIAGVRENDYFTEEQALQYVRACDWLIFPPGQRWRYGNTGYFLLAQIVQRVSGQSLPEFADRQIFQPLGMSSTFFRDDRTKIIKHRAEGYSSYSHLHYNDPAPRYTTRGDALSINAATMEFGGAGGVFSTVRDLARWDQNFYQNRLGKGSPELIRKLTAPGPHEIAPGWWYGYGLFVGEREGVRFQSHSGWTGGYSAMLLRLPDLKTSVIILGNQTDLIHQIDVHPGSSAITDKLAALLTDGRWRYSGGDAGAPAEGEATAPTQQPQMYQDPATSWIWAVTGSASDGWQVQENFGRTYRPEGLDVHPDRITAPIDGVERHFQRFIEPPFDLAEYAGQYHCAAIGTGFTVSPDGDGLRLTNTNRRHTGVDLHYRPTIKDSFLAQCPPYISWYCISFNRDEAGRVTSLIYRDDEGTQRERLIFQRVC